MKNGTKVYQKIKALKISLNKNNSRNNITTSSKQYNYYEENYPESFIKSKSLNKIQIKKGINKKGIKLPSLKKNNFIEKNNTKLMKKFLVKNNSNIKLKISTNNINNYHSKNKSSNKLLSKHSGSSYNLKISQNYYKTKKINLTTSSTSNLGLGRYLDRKVITSNKNIVMPKNGYKLFTTTKIINNFNNQINQNKNKEVYTLYNDDTQNNRYNPNNLLSHENDQIEWNENISNENNFNESKKLDVLYEIEKKVSKIQNCFRKHLKEEETVDTTNHQNDVVNNNAKNDNIFDIISDISLSEEEINFSEEDSLDKNEFSLDVEDL